MCWGQAGALQSQMWARSPLPPMKSPLFLCSGLTCWGGGFGKSPVVPAPWPLLQLPQPFLGSTDPGGTSGPAALGMLHPGQGEMQLALPVVEPL